MSGSMTLRDLIRKVQAEKELGLTWKDIQRIVEIADDILLDPQRPRRLSTTKEAYYTEVLRRYKEVQK